MKYGALPPPWIAARTRSLGAKEPKTVYVDEGMELGEVSVLEQKATAISSEDLEATPVAELPPSVGKMI